MQQENNISVGISPTNVDKSRILFPGQLEKMSGVARSEIMEKIKVNWEPISLAVGDTFVTARNVLDWFHKQGLLTNLVKANAIGDVLGKHGFDLPYAIFGKGRKYLIPCVTWDSEERDSFLSLPVDDQLIAIGDFRDTLFGNSFSAMSEVSGAKQEVREPITGIFADEDVDVEAMVGHSA